MSWVKKKILIIVKAYPERSGSYGSLICMAGLTEDNDWIRIYPVPFDYYIRKLKFKKFTWIEAEVRKSREKLMRKESYKVNENSINIIDTNLANLKGKSQKERSEIWAQRRKILENKLSDSIYELDREYKSDKTSLGLIKPKSFCLNFRKPLKDIKIETEKFLQKTLSGDKILVADKIEHSISYKFKCEHPDCFCNKNDKKFHDITCEDWELFQPIRDWPGSPEEVEQKIKKKFEDWMKIQRDLYFIMGMYSLQPSWMIIGLFYPPKIEVGIGLQKWISKNSK